MFAVLYSDTHRALAENIVSDLAVAYAGRVESMLFPASAPAAWGTDLSWDDLLIVLFDRLDFPDAGQQFIQEYQIRSAQRGMVLPVAIEQGHQKPPLPVEGIKALIYDTDAKGPKGRLMRRVGAMLGLQVQSREKRVFISYRTKDGSAIADQLYGHLKTLGYEPWQDQARELDGDPKILPGSPVQKEIDDALEQANLVLLVDTPSAPHSEWIKHEVDTAHSLLLPVLPLCFREASDPKKIPRFRSLLELGRWVLLETPDVSLSLPLSSDQIDLIILEMENFLCEMFQRKFRVPFLVEKEFVSRQFDWRVVNQRMLMFESKKQKSWRVPLTVLSHCSLFDQVHAPGLKKLAEFLDNAERNSRANHALYIYEGELIPEPELKEITETHETSAIILHHQELSALIDSNFTTLAA